MEAVSLEKDKMLTSASTEVYTHKGIYVQHPDTLLPTKELLRKYKIRYHLSLPFSYLQNVDMMYVCIVEVIWGIQIIVMLF